MGFFEILLAIATGVLGSLIAAWVLELRKSKTDVEIMMDAIKAAEKIARKDAQTARRWLDETRAALLADLKHRKDDLNGEISRLIASEAPDRKAFQKLRQYYKTKKAAVEERRRTLSDRAKRGEPPPQQA